MSHEIFLKCFIEYLFLLFNTWFRYWIVWYFVQYIMQIVHIANWCTWLAHTLCKGLVWNYKNCWGQPWLSFGMLQGLRWSWECIRSGFFFYQYRILLWNFEICTISIFWNDVFIHLFFKELFRLLNCLNFFCWFCSLLSFGWWYTLMKNKHQIIK